MANTVATLVVQTSLLPNQSPSSLSPFPSLLTPVEDGDDDGEKGGEDEKEPEADVLAGVEMVTSSSPGTTTSQNPEHPFQCMDCGKSFKWSSRLAHHQRSHNNERPYRCNICPKAFKGSSALLYHQRSHSGEKPYKCEDCGKAFKRSSLLQVHRSVHTGLRTFKCHYCPLTFKWSSHYQYHLRQHTGECPYPCDSCPKAFKNSSSLRRHKNVHLGVKPYVCVVCSKAFSQSTNLRQHMRIHTGERPYVCGECGRSFTHSSNLALHRNSHLEGKAKGGAKAGKAGPRTNVEVVLEGTTSDDLRAVGMSISDMVGLVGGQEGGVGQVFLSHDMPSSSTVSSSKGGSDVLTFTPTAVAGSEHMQVSMGEGEDTGANVLLYSCGSCNQTFSTQTSLEQHQALHLDGLGEGSTDTTGDGIEPQGDRASLVGAAPLLADFEEVVETTAVSESTQGAEQWGRAGVQVQYDLLHSFSSSMGQMPSDGDVSRADLATRAAPCECAYCGKSFKSSNSLSRHVAQAHPLALNQPHSRSQFSCSACDRSFPLLSALLTHQLSHTEEQRLLAEAEAEIVCPPSLALSLPLPSSPSTKRDGEEAEGEREIHVSLIAVPEEGERQVAKLASRASGKPGRRGGGSKSAAANNERPYRCSECGKSFKGSSGLRYHMRDHTGERPYRCTECGKSFKRSSLLSIHQRVHTGVRAFQCPYCSLTFKWSSHYQYHLRQHTGERPYVCQECGKSFKNTSCLRRHSQLHSGLRPHACSVCGKAFSQTSNLKQHERTHSGERPFQCAQCHKSFTHSSNLQLHLRTHSSRKDFKCQHCGKEFVMHSYLQRHLRTHGGASGGPACTREAGKAGKGGAGAAEVTASALGLNVSASSGLGSLFPADGSSTLILSPPNLDIPPNTSQNYFMIQTPMGLQLIPLSNPTPTQPAPPPPPPPPPQPPSQNFLLLQCQSTNGNQPSLILVPTASNTNASPAPSAPQTLPLVQTIPALPQVLTPTQTQISQFQPLQTQQRFILTNNNAPLITAPAQNTTAITRPILGTLGRTRNTRTRRGRKPKLRAQKSSLVVQTPSTPASHTLLPSTTSAIATAETSITPSTALSKQLNVHVSTSVPPLNTNPAPVSSSVPTTVTLAAVTPTVASAVNPCPSVGRSLSEPAAEKLPDPLAGERFVLCFEKETEAREQGQGMEVKVEMEGGVDGGRSYVLQFEGEGEQGGGTSGDGGEKSYVLRFQAEGENEGGGGKDKMVSLNLLQDWATGQEGERMEGMDGDVGVEEKSFVLHFQTEPQSDEEIHPNVSYSEGQSEQLGLSCHPAQALMPLGGQEVVFELGNEAKIDGGTGSGERVQMIALIEGEGSSSETGDRFANQEGVIGPGAGQMEGIFQLEGGEGIVIIEVSTSSLREGTEGGVSLGLRNVEKEVITAQDVMSDEQKGLEAESRHSSAGVNGTEG